jgi:hypothetical protein
LQNLILYINKEIQEAWPWKNLPRDWGKWMYTSKMKKKKTCLRKEYTTRLRLILITDD